MTAQVDIRAVEIRNTVMRSHRLELTNLLVSYSGDPVGVSVEAMPLQF